MKHGMTIRGDGPTRLPADPTYRSWSAMRSRCLNENHSRYDQYGGRGIKICNRWSIFQKFLEDLGPRPENYSIGRKNNNEDYSPENCRWESNLEQSRNKSSTRWVDVFGEIISLAEAVEKYSSVSYYAVRMRIQRGWDDIDAILTPKR